MINAESAEQFEVLLRVIGTLDGSRAEPATPPADDPAPEKPEGPLDAVLRIIGERKEPPEGNPAA